MSRIGIVTGMLAEAACASTPGKSSPPDAQPLVFVSGADSERAYEGASALAIQGAGALLSFGLAGGLDPALAAGDIVLADSVVLPDGSRIATDGAWRAALGKALASRKPITGAIVGQNCVMATEDAKAALRSRTGAVAVDMESHAVARAAKAAGVPFMALRVVLDPASRAIPWSALAGIGEDGRSQALPVIGRLLLKPWELAALLSLARANRRAIATLGRLASDLAPTFGLVV